MLDAHLIRPADGPIEDVELAHRMARVENVRRTVLAQANASNGIEAGQYWKIGPASMGTGVVRVSCVRDGRVWCRSNSGCGDPVDYPIAEFRANASKVMA